MVDETVNFLRGYLEAIEPEPVLEEPILAPTVPPADAAAKPAAVIQSVPTVAKVKHRPPVGGSDD